MSQSAEVVAPPRSDPVMPPSGREPRGSGGEPSMARKLWGLLGPRRLNAIYLAAVFLIVFTALNPGVYLTGTTMTVVFSAGVVTCLMALAFLVPLTGGNYDLAIGAMMTFALTVTCKLFLSTGLPLVLIAVLALAACALVGMVSGLIIVKLHVDSFIATLGMSQILLAGSLLLSGNTQLVGNFPETWSNLGNDTVIGIPIPLIGLLVIAAVLWYVLEQTRLGRYLFATGGNREAARLSGVPTSRLIVWSMVASGVIAGFAGVVYSMQAGVAVSNTGDGLLFPAVTAVFLGASQFSQRPNVWGTIVAYFTLAFGIQGLTISLGSSAAWASPVFQGVALIIAVSIASRPMVKKLRSPRAAPAVAEPATARP